MANYTTTTMRRISVLSTERQALWAKSGRGERLTEAERGRLIDIRADLDDLWKLRRQEKATARAGDQASVLDSSVVRSPSPARQDRRRGRAERRAASLFR